MQHDIFPNPNRSLRRVYPFIACLQSDFVDGSHRVVAPLIPLGMTDRKEEVRYLPVVRHDGQDYVVLLTLIAAVPARLLRTASGSIRGFRAEIMRGIDWLFTGL